MRATTSIGIAWLRTSAALATRDAELPRGCLPGALGELVLDGADLDVAVWWVGVHGGSGESTLERVFRGTRASGHRWPVACAPARPAVVLVARTDARGLWATQAALRDLHSRGLNVELLGLVLMADAPRRLPRAVRDLQRVVSGGVPRVWCLGWVEGWRDGEVPSRANSPKEAERLLEDLRAARGRRGAVDVNERSPANAVAGAGALGVPGAAWRGGCGVGAGWVWRWRRRRWGSSIRGRGSRRRGRSS